MITKEGWLFRPVNRWLVFLFFFTLAANASAEWKEKVLYSFQGSPDAATPAGGVVFDKVGNLYGAALGGPQYSQGTVFQLAPPAKKGDSWTESVLYVFQGKPVNDGQIPTGGLIIDSAGNLYGVTGYGGTGACILLGNPVGCGTVYELSPPKEKGGKWTETILYSFQGGKDGYFPNGTLVFDGVGNLYGATDYGGGYGSCNAPFYQYCGTIFKLSPPTTKSGKWKEKVLYSFKSSTDGANPNGGLIFDSKGTIYGTTYFGGSQGCKLDQGIGCGTIFQLSPPLSKREAWSEKVLYRFKSDPDAAEPAAGVILDKNNNLYGTTLGGGNSGWGTVYELKRSSGTARLWSETVLYSFNEGEDGATPMAGLIFDSRGDLYGTAQVGGGSSRYGDVYRLRRPGPKMLAWTLDVLYGFANGAPAGAQPSAAVLFDQFGNLYSTTVAGGSGTDCGFSGCGTVFEISP